MPADGLPTDGYTIYGFSSFIVDIKPKKIIDVEDDSYTLGEPMVTMEGGKQVVQDIEWALENNNIETFYKISRYNLQSKKQELPQYPNTIDYSQLLSLVGATFRPSANAQRQ